MTDVMEPEIIDEDVVAQELEVVEAPVDDDVPVVRLGLAVALPVIGTAIMVGGVFEGAEPRPYAAVAGILGIVLAAVVRRFNKPVVTNLLIALGIFAIGLIVVIPT